MQCPDCAGSGIAASPPKPRAHEPWSGDPGDMPGIACPACGGSGIRAAAGSPRRRPPSAEEQLHIERQLLVFTLRYGRAVPAGEAEDWISALYELSVATPEASAVIVAALRERFDRARPNPRPGDRPPPALVEREADEIERMLGFLAALLEHAAEWIAAGEGKRA